MLSSKLATQGLFQQTLADVLRKLRSASSTAAEEAMLPKIMEDIKKEITSPVTAVKVVAIQKALYFSMLGYSTEFAFFPIVEIMADRNFGNKRFAYMAASLLFTENADVIPLTTGLLLRDLQNGGNSHHQGLALSFLANVCTPDLARDVVSYVVQMLDTRRYPPALRKKAVMCLYKLFLDFPESLRHVYLQLKDKIDDSSDNKDDHPGVRSAVVCVLCELVRRMPATYLGLAIPLYSLLSTIEGNWGLIKIVKMFAYLLPHEPRLVKKLTAPFEKLLSNTKAVSVKYECYRTIATTDLATVPSLAAFTVDGLKIFLESRDQNLRFMGLEALSLLAFRCSSSLHTSTSACLIGLLQPLRKIVIRCLADEDITIRRKAALILRETTGEKQLISAVMELSASMHYLRQKGTESPQNNRRGEMWEEKDEVDEEDAEEVSGVTLAGGGRRILYDPHGKVERQRQGKGEVGGTVGRRLQQLIENSSHSTRDEGSTSQRRIVRRWMNEVVGCIVDVVRREDYSHLSDVEWYLAVLLKLFQDFLHLSPAAEFRVGHLLKEEVIQLVLRVPEARSFAVEAFVQGLLLSPPSSGSVVPFSFFSFPTIFPLAPPPPLSSWCDGSCRESPAEPLFSRSASPPSDTTVGVHDSSFSLTSKKEVWSSGGDRRPNKKKRKNDLLSPFVLSSSSTVMSGWHVVAAATIICGEYCDPSSIFTTLVANASPPPPSTTTPTRRHHSHAVSTSSPTLPDSVLACTSSLLCLCARWCHPTLRRYPPSLQCTCLWGLAKLVSSMLCLTNIAKAGEKADGVEGKTAVENEEEQNTSQTSLVSCASSSSSLSSISVVETLAERWWTGEGNATVTSFFLTSPYPRVAATARMIIGILNKMVEDRKREERCREEVENKGDTESLTRQTPRNWFFKHRSLQPAVSWSTRAASLGDDKKDVWLLSPLHVAMKMRRKVTKGAQEESCVRRPIHTGSATTTVTVDMSAFLCPAVEEMLIFTESVEEEEDDEEVQEEWRRPFSGGNALHETHSSKRSPAWRHSGRATHTTFGSSLLSCLSSRASPTPNFSLSIFPPELQRPLTAAALRGERRTSAWRNEKGSTLGTGYSPAHDAALAPYYLDDKEDDDEEEDLRRHHLQSRGGEEHGGRETGERGDASRKTTTVEERRRTKKTKKRDGEEEEERGVPPPLWFQTGRQMPSRVHPHTGSKVPRMGGVHDEGVESRKAVSEEMDGKDDDEEVDVVTRRLQNVDVRRALTKEDVLPRTAPTYDELFKMAEEAKRVARDKKKAAKSLRPDAEKREEEEEAKKRRKEKKHKKLQKHHDKKSEAEKEEIEEEQNARLQRSVPPTSSSSSPFPDGVLPSSLPPRAASKGNEESTTTVGTLVLCDNAWVKVLIRPIPPLSSYHGESKNTSEGQKEREENQWIQEEEKLPEKQSAWNPIGVQEVKTENRYDPRSGMAELVSVTSSLEADDQGHSFSPQWWGDTQVGAVESGEGATAPTKSSSPTTSSAENSSAPHPSTEYHSFPPLLELSYDVSVTFMPSSSAWPPVEVRNPEKRDAKKKKHRKEKKEEKQDETWKGRSGRKDARTGTTSRMTSIPTLQKEQADEFGAWAPGEEDCSKWVMTHIHLALFTDEQRHTNEWLASPLPCPGSTETIGKEEEQEERSARQDGSASPSSPQWRLLPMPESSETSRIIEGDKRMDDVPPLTPPPSSLSMLCVAEKLRPQETAHLKCRIQMKTSSSASLLSSPVPFALLFRRGPRVGEKVDEVNHVEKEDQMEENRGKSVQRDMHRLSVPFSLPFHHLRPSLRIVEALRLQPTSSHWSSSVSPSQQEGRGGKPIPLAFLPMTAKQDSLQENGSTTATIHAASAHEVGFATSSLYTSYVYRCYMKEIEAASSAQVLAEKEHVADVTSVSHSNSLHCPPPSDGNEEQHNEEEYHSEDVGDATRRKDEGGKERMEREIADGEREMASVEGRNEKVENIVSEVVWTEVTDLLLSIPHLQIELGLQAVEVFSTAMTLCTVVLGRKEKYSCDSLMEKKESSYLEPMTLMVLLQKVSPLEEECTAKHNFTESSPASDGEKRKVDAECFSSLVLSSNLVKKEKNGKENHSQTLLSRSSERFPVSVTVCCADRHLLQDALHRIVQILIQCVG